MHVIEFLTENGRMQKPATLLKRDPTTDSLTANIKIFSDRKHSQQRFTVELVGFQYVNRWQVGKLKLHKRKVLWTAQTA